MSRERSVIISHIFVGDSTNNANVSLTGNVTFNVDGSSGRRTSLRGTSEAEDSYQEEDSTSQDYKPVIPLPAEVEMKTGEEDEKVLFEERGKLFRYVNKEWKERGVGLIKILHNEQTGRSRILMRRDHVWKTCANHLIYRDMILTAAKNSDKAWLWGAQDYADGEVKTEQFCIKFKTREIALLFQEKFDWAKSLVSKTHTDSSLGANDKKNDSNLEMDGVTCAKGVVIDKTTESPSQHDFSALQNSESSSSSSKWIGGNSDASVRSGPGSFAPSIILGDNRNDHLSVATDSSTAPIIKPTTITILDKDNEISSHSGGDNFVFGGACAEPQPKSSGYEFGASSSKSRTVVPVLNIQSDINIIFGGFSFKAPPVLKQTKDDADNAVEKSKDATVANSLLSETAKVSPFAGFTFNLPPKDKVDNSAKPQNSTVSSFPGFSFNAKPSETMTSLTVLKDNKQSNVGKELDSKESTAFILGSGSSVSEMSFSNLAKGVSDTDAFKKDSSFEGFSGQGQKVFGDSSDATKGSHSHDEDFEPDVDFKPVVNLPQIIDLKTGEEDEEKLFGERAKLFRYNTESKEWKERGVGEIKILFNRLTKRLRILMRREQVFKLCANHYITRDMKLQPMATSDRAWVWYANDFSEGELRQEKLAVKFKSPEVASAFKEAFEKHQHEVFKEKTVDTPSKDISQVKPPSPKLKWSCASCYSRNNAEFSECLACKTPRPTTTQSSCIPAEALSELFKPSEGSWECSSCLVRNEKGQTNCVACHANKPGLGSSAPNIILTCAPSTKTTNSGPLSALFKPSEGSWECSSCLVRNEKTHVNCISCQAPKPGLAFHATVVSTPEASLSSSRSSEPPPLSALFKPSEGSWECSSCLVRNEKGRVNCISCETAKPGTGSPANTTSTPTSFLSTPPAFKFGFNKSGEGLAAPNTSGFSFEMSTPSFKFGIPQTSDITTTTTTSSPSSAVEFRFGTPQKFTFSFGGVRPLSPTKTPKSPIDDSTEGEGEDDTIGGESEGDSIYFHPQIPLPDKIEVRTGEEDEEILYCQRAKLFRLADGEWKERGLGDFKILLHRASSKFRFLMRRDQILKICCNHYLTPNITLRAKDDRSWLWYAYDFSDNETKCETLALRFKTPELAKTFKQTVDVVQQLMKDERLPLPVKDSSPAKTDSVSTFSFKAEDAQVNASPKSTFTFGDRFSSRVQKIGSRGSFSFS